MVQRREFSTLLAAAAAGLTLSPALSRGADAAAGYPSRPVRLIVPLAAGGGVEVAARQFGEILAKDWGQPIVVEARPGGNGMIGAVAVSQSPADGYTALFTNSGLIQNAHLRPSPAFRFENFAPVAMLAYAAPALAIQAAIPARTLAEFVAWAKARPGKLSFGSYGAGSSGHLLGETLNKTAGLDLVHVAYRGESAAVQDMLGGQIVALFGAAGSLGRQSGPRLRVIAVASPKRLPGFPDLPTFAESGYADMNLPGWMAMFMPAGTPAEVVAKMAEGSARALALPEFRDALVKGGFEPASIGPAEFAAFLKNDYERWGELIRRTGVKVE
ncbi:MAG: tripartite tricarboxylate transporter substrate binding protein [Rubrivivax sp.]